MKKLLQEFPASETDDDDGDDDDDHDEFDGISITSPNPSPIPTDSNVPKAPLLPHQFILPPTEEEFPYDEESKFIWIFFELSLNTFCCIG